MGEGEYGNRMWWMGMEEAAGRGRDSGLCRWCNDERRSAGGGRWKSGRASDAVAGHAV